MDDPHKFIEVFSCLHGWQNTGQTLPACRAGYLQRENMSMSSLLSKFIKKVAGFLEENNQKATAELYEVILV